MIKNKIKIEYVVMSILLFLLCYLFPYTGDDWAWGSSIGIERLNNWFDNYSGRYIGNLIVLVLTRSIFLKTIAMVVCLGGIIILLDKLTDCGKYGFYIIVLNMFFMPIVIFRQAIVWTAGFANYTTSIFLTLIYIYYVRKIFKEDKAPKFLNKAAIPLFLLAIGNTLIVEHLTIYNVILAVFVIVHTFIKFRKVFFSHVVYLVGTICGTLYMFSNSVYRSVSNGQDGYRTIGSDQGVIHKVLSNYFNTIVEEGFLNNVFLNACLVLVCVLVWKEVKKNISKKLTKIGKASIGIMIAYLTICILNWNAYITQLRLLKYVEGFATIAFILALICFIFVLPVTRNEKIIWLFILGSIGCMIAPLLVVSPIGSRCFFASYVMFIYLMLQLSKYIGIEVQKKAERMIDMFKIVTFVSILYFYYIYGTNFIYDQKRIEKARTDIANGETVIEVKELPYPEYLWFSSPTGGTIWAERFVLFYDLGENIIIK